VKYTRPRGRLEARSNARIAIEVSSMMRGVTGLSFLPSGFAHAHTRLARWAVGLAEAAVAVVVAGAVLFGVAWVIGGTGATEDNWVGSLTAATLYAGLLASLTAFVAAVVARVRHEAWALLWVPLVVLPAMAVLLLVGETFWWQ
jgi:hypothetical protein